jgi:hypothetical protein
MENSNSLSSTILQSNEPISSIGSTSNLESSSISNNDYGFFESLKSINFTTWLILILIFAFLGFNIFVYLAKGTQSIANFFAPLTEKIFGTTVLVTGQTVDVTAEGAKAVVGGVANTVNSGLSTIQDITPNSASTTITSQPVETQKDTSSNTTLNKALNSSQEQNQDYQAHEASSSVHGGISGKSGWCFIGQDRGYRSCALVNEDDKCMSGDIFPSQELCINPSLRA